MEKEISFVIVTYNSRNYIEDCLKSIGVFLDVNPSTVEIIIVDNSSGREAVKMKMLCENHPINDILEVKFLQNNSNLGYGQGNNLGIKASGGKIIAIMNPDVRFLEPLLSDVIAEFKSKTLALLGYRQRGGFNYSFYTKPEYKTPLSIWKIKLTNKLQQFNSDKHYLSGAFLFLERKQFEKSGLFDENIFLYYEEPDITNRLQEIGGEIKFKKDKKYLHLVGDRVEFSSKSFESQIVSLKYYLQKFNFDHHKIAKNYITEYRIKMIIAKILGDKVRIEKFLGEIKIIKEIFK